jgi:NAD(P)-dependent dehydrogenase (short-subunit alcohol dehydrogenase family)
VTRLFDLSRKIALVTGGAKGLGRMIAEGFLRAGCKVYITSRDVAAGELAAREMSEVGTCIALGSDLATPEAAVSLSAQFKAREPVLHVLVNNAGRTWAAPLESFPDKAWPGVLALNVQGPFTLVREFLSLLKAGGSDEDPSRVINIGSLAGAVVERISAYSYAASKAALHHLSKTLAADLAEHHITVNVVVPGYFPTKMTAHIRNQEDETEKLLARVPLARLGRPDDIAGACVFLASRSGSYVTGSELFIDGGMAGCR